MNPIYDIIIIGGGPIGIACGLEAKKAGLSYLILEKGCLVNSLYNYPANMTFFSTSERIEIGGIPFVSNNVKPTRSEALEYYRRVAVSNRLLIHLQEKVLKIVPVEEGAGKHFDVISSAGSYGAGHVILATGFYDLPVLLDIPGEELPKVTHYYKEPHFYAMQKVAVVGASNSAVDAALETWRKGAEVTMVIRGEGIGQRVKYWVKPDIENRIKEGSIAAYMHSSLLAIREKEIDIQTPEGLKTLPNDYVIALTGYQPGFDFLRQAGVRLSDDPTLEPQYDRDSMESNVKHLYLAGVVCGGMNTHSWFIENSRVHAIQIVEHIMKNRY
ncbi:MAG: YpdA family putative bacillithiol disulfide reductase [Bacteroidota bacterium]|nr:YpdA family putative bacillithiol disulfide reductase [Bacteroidota bacterium]MDP4218138.1 YpdA family putative bacillithiol disulfide reductase [Bacteroidota bacterium]MDP4246410.1 YpdA family putative bacillithiol disulfide reductase [Bacteroidota bacterium]MDP4252931.1 YpdA family putative bacillithiol disulfide reductase [Bacteroidota bacterium]MDP4256958.1 YpdA family putative bacillithiol disulfide reductase [Bacteroidota bacterium]